MNKPLLKVVGLTTLIRGGSMPMRAVDGISFEIAAGETFALVGESGCGKSMTALSIMRLLPEAGEIAGGAVELAGEDLLVLPESRMRDVRGRRVAMIFQEPGLSLNPVMTVGAQIAEAVTRHTALTGAAVEARVLELLDAVRMPDARRRMTEYPFQMSGGMKQRVMIAIALACDPELLIADEPTTALDVTVQAQVLDLLRELQRSRGMAMLLITHDLGVVAQMAQQVAVMYAGEIIETAAVNAFFAGPAHPYSRKLFESLPDRAGRGKTLAAIRGTVPALTRQFAGCRFAERCDSALAHCADTIPAWGAVRDGQRAKCHLYGSDDRGLRIEERTAESCDEVRSSILTPQSSILRIEDLQVHFPIRKGLLQRIKGQVKAVDGVSLSIAPGRTLGLVGESGCGKTTVGKGLLRLVPPTGGQVLFDGVDLLTLDRSALRDRRRHAQIIFQDPYASLNPRVRIGDALEEGMLALGIGGGEEERALRINALLVEVGLAPDVKGRYPHEFSGGQRQRIAIARALSVEPQLIVCDEPTSALDVSVQAQILNLLKRLQREKGLAYLFISHNMAVVEYMADELAVMYLGRIVERGTVAEVLHDPKHPYTRALLAAVPVADPKAERPVIRVDGDLPSPVNPPQGCHFHPRCGVALPCCGSEYPDDHNFSVSHATRCHLYG
ncbi:MAG: ABC transporter ATP-binding protein [Burkholderiales bacterium]|jgi:peptide/nickel transport system ATP-binding protein|nr:ABC transporter ATP-binding protein [Burkholderiales bacterium]